MVKVPYWLGSGGKDELYLIDLDAKFNLNDPSTTILSQFMGKPAGEVDPIYDVLINQRGHEYVAKVEVEGVEYDGSSIVDFTIANTITEGDEFEIGAAVVSELTLRMRTSDVIPPNAKVVPYIALSLNSLTWNEADYAWNEADWPFEGGQTEWMPLGEFYVDYREKINDIWTFTCLDQLVYANVPYISQLSYPATMQAVWDEICDRLDYAYDSSVQIDPTYMVGAGPAGYSCRQVLSYIASAHSASIYVGKDGLLRFRKYTSNDDPVIELGPADYVRSTQTNTIKTYTRVVVVYDVDDGLYYEAGTGDDRHTLFVDNPFGTQEMADNILSDINGFSYLPVEMRAKGFPHLDQGDLISLGTIESVAWEDANISWEDADFPWDGTQEYKTIVLHQTLSFAGGLHMSIEAPSISDQQSEIQLEGELTQQVNRLNRDALKFDKPYHGVTHSREDGIVTQRTDGTKKLTINSDVLLDWEVNGVRKLYYDEADDAIKFSGVIEASEFIGGVIEGGTINGGEINAATINGGEITGSTITGSLIQTSETYPRIELSNAGNLLTAYKTASSKIEISPEATPNAVLAFEDGASRADITLGGLSFIIGTLTSNISLVAGQSLNLTAQGGDINLSPSGQARIANWGKLYNNATARTLQTELNDLQSSINSKATGSGLTTMLYVADSLGGAANKQIFVSNGVILSVT